MIRPEEPEVITKGGIILVKSAKDMPDRGTIVAVGPGTEKFPMPEELQVGTMVLFQRYAGSEIYLDGDPNEYIVTDVKEVLGCLSA